MVSTWDPKGSISGSPKFYPDNPFGPSFFVNRYNSVAVKGNTGVFAEVDGPVHWAMMLPDASSPGCRFGTEAATPSGRFVVKVSGNYSDKEVEGQEEGVLLAGLEEPLRVALRRPEPSIGANLRASDSWVAELGGLGFTVWTWDFTTKYKPALTPPEPAPATNVFHIRMLEDAVFYNTEGSVEGTISVWTKEEGTRSLLKEEGVNFDNFATDGKEMVWSRLEGLMSFEPPYDYEKKELWTAPFTRDREVLKGTARRVTKARAAVSLRPWVIGCGYAAISFSDDEYNRAIQVVRLSDGRTWIIDNQGVPKFSWGRTVGLTCKELFTLMDYGPKTNIARIRLDSLGEGQPPD
jgi:hypothetical protein